VTAEVRPDTVLAIFLTCSYLFPGTLAPSVRVSSRSRPLPRALLLILASPLEGTPERDDPPSPRSSPTGSTSDPVVSPINWWTRPGISSVEFPPPPLSSTSPSRTFRNLALFPTSSWGPLTPKTSSLASSRLVSTSRLRFQLVLLVPTHVTPPRHSLRDLNTFCATLTRRPLDPFATRPHPLRCRRLSQIRSWRSTSGWISSTSGLHPHTNMRVMFTRY